MLSFGVKIAWFVLSLTGLLCSTIVLCAFGRVLGSQWGPMLFCFGNILVQGMFCLGMIYRMDPFSMPRSFCLVQSILISFGADLLAGVTLAFSVATYLAVLKPKTWSDGPRALQWRNVYALPIIVIPILASTAQTVVVLKIDTFHPTDGMHCDSTSPQWPRMLGYAGIPFLMSLPSLYLSLMSFLQIRKTNKHLQRSRPDSFTEFKYGARVSRTRTREISFIQSEASKRDSLIPPTVMMTTTTPANPASSARQYHLPFRPPSFHSVSADERSKSNLSGRIESEGGDDASSRISVSFPTFVNPPLPPPPAVAAYRDQTVGLHQVDGSLHEQKNRWQGDINMEVIRVSGSVVNDSGDWTEDKADLGSELDLHEVYAMYNTEPLGKALESRSQSGSPLPYRKPRKEFPTLSPTISWIIRFQFAYFLIPFLSSLSTFIDIVTKQNRPTPLGSQHVALLLAAWGPALLLGHLPMVRSYMVPGRYVLS